MSKKKPNLNAGHRQRMRNRFIETGFEGFADHEVLEMLLFYSIPRQDTNKMAHRIVNEFGSLYAVLEATPAELMRRCGLTENTSVFLAMQVPLARRYNTCKWDVRHKFASSKDMGEYAVSLFFGYTIECFYLICLNNDLRLIRAIEVARGTINRVELYIREILENVINCKAVFVVIAHNHPSGSVQISSADRETTAYMMDVFAKHEIVLLDHIIVGGTDYFSFAEKRLLKLQGVENAKS